MCGCGVLSLRYLSHAGPALFGATTPTKITATSSPTSPGRRWPMRSRLRRGAAEVGHH
ncbi:hypothetical protein QJS04_geneDACA020212 [Acorus gramineus]|uniref:Uncharacterized protein n=1 Tax=Acorus gramineus TaxID=55184 RepID=A0AAV9BLF7_ACOGR|nr:hypothetical protein QJS04_geneDACA020212 [Acorus gramineus]